jgi:hypothetical protein
MSDAQAHLSELREGVTRLRSRAPQLQDRWLLVAGGVLLPLGLALIVLGWYGTAQTTLDFEQTPYLISGGLLGLALVITGGLLYFSFWLTRLVRDGRAEAARTAAHQQRVEEALTAIAAGLGAREAAPALVVTVGGSMLHRPDCAATRGEVVTRVGSHKGLTACGLCRPELGPDVDRPARSRARARA